MATDKNLVKKTNAHLAQTIDDRPALSPAVDIYENQDEYLLIADLPAVTSDNVKLHLDGELLTLRASRADEVDYRRSFYLPDGVDFQRSRADLKDGVLSISLPKSTAAKPRRIQVRAG
jgi:HSP20 family protein